MYRVIIAGSREFQFYDVLEYHTKGFLKGLYPKEIQVISGTARGADQLGERFAKEHGCRLRQMPADWSKGPAAGPIRNEDMAKVADGCIVFWDGKSKGTKSMISLAQKYDLDLTVIKFNCETNIIKPRVDATYP